MTEWLVLRNVSKRPGEPHRLFKNETFQIQKEDNPSEKAEEFARLAWIETIYEINGLWFIPGQKRPIRGTKTEILKLLTEEEEAETEGSLPESLSNDGSIAV